jgi:formylglycine-generating enzyme required for sulfatase activity/serine/threonine protein kinase
VDAHNNDLPLSRRKEIDRLVDQFEREFRAGGTPRIEDYLQQQPDLRENLLAELLALEIDLRQTAGDPLGVEECHRRFPAAMFSSSTMAIDHEPHVADNEDEYEPQPEKLGRYEIRRVLGRGGFGIVYLAHDPQLDRPVAVKLPRRKRFRTAEHVASFVEEARRAANLKHPLLVAVHDVQQQDGLPYIVQEYLDGQNLGEWAAKSRPSFEQIARVLVGVAEALGYVHQRGLTHCDLKLTNVLMDTMDQPHVADFGLAVHESALTLRKGEVFGTPATMAPEQVRGESHRLDGRTDIWAIGVMLYELLVGRRPFAASSRNELYTEIQAHDPKPPRLIDRRVPRELERICLKCMSKRRTDRYSTTDDLREDLLAWLGKEPATQVPQSTSVVTSPFVSAPDSSSGSKPTVKIVPKGLRSFDAEDADFFLELLPGPRDREGLPESIRFWKNRIEEPDPDKTFCVGLIFGPSGCGKSSLVKAGLLPRLSDRAVPIYVEATASDTEVRILKQLHKHIPHLPADIPLPDACAELRLTGAGRDRKVVLVIDQFEQWLHAHAKLKNSQLVDALRQSEGGRLQALLLARDDFYLSVNRVFQELEIRLLEGQNYSAVDLFDLDHARKLLIAFGRAYGKLPDELATEHERFVHQAVDQLAEDHKVISVRLALFADMMKTRSWVPQSLQEIGGVGGVGVTFLEETFAAKTAPPAHRVHENAIRGVLKALLPEGGTDIKGSKRSADQLCEASGYHDKPQQFDQLMQILDSEVRLITPTDPDGRERESDCPFYQLTHDYLVPSLRDWLTRKQQETRRGRAELRLDERAALWTARPERQQLPSWWEVLTIWLFTRRRNWTESQQRMMRRATVVHCRKALVLVLIVATMAVSADRGIRWNRASQVDVRIDAVLNALPDALPNAVARLRPFQQEVIGELRGKLEVGQLDATRRLHVLCALAELGEADAVASILALTKNATDAEGPNVCSAVKQHPQESLTLLDAALRKADTDQDWALKARLATLSLFLRNTEWAADMLVVDQRPDPIQRTIFIETFAAWHGDLVQLSDIVAPSQRPALRSGICLAAGSVSDSDVTAKLKRAWKPLAESWYLTQPDAGTHCAAQWLLRKWGMTLPDVPVARAPVEGNDWYHNSSGMVMLKIPAGEFIMDSLQFLPPDQYADEGPQHHVVLTRPYYMGVYEVSQAEYERVMGSNPSSFEGARNPVENVSWEEAAEFCRRLSELPEEKAAGRVYRLPTDAEWEYACRAGTTTTYSFGADTSQLGEYSWFEDNSGNKTHPLGQKRPNGWGLYDMHGNVYEWCQDWYGNYTETAVVDPQGPSIGLLRVARGGSWKWTARHCWSTNRDWSSPTAHYSDLGFRVALVPSIAAVVPRSAADQPLLTPKGVPPQGFIESKPSNVAEEASSDLTNSIGMVFKLISAGEFLRGNPEWEPEKDGDEGSRSHATIGPAYYLGMCEVNQAEYERVMGNNPSRFKGVRNPVENVSWEEAAEFCRRLSELPEEKAAGRVYRLPTSAEWEYACRAATTTTYSFGVDSSQLGEFSWLERNSASATHTVGEKYPNGWGLHDMYGNVWEWCQEDDHFVQRGGGWSDPTIYGVPYGRTLNIQSRRDSDLGFRVAQVPSGSQAPSSGSANGDEHVLKPDPGPDQPK